MKKTWLVFTLLITLFCGVAIAEEATTTTVAPEVEVLNVNELSDGSGNVSIVNFVKALPGWKQGFMWDIPTHQVNYLSTLEIASYKNVALEVGWGSSSTAVAIISYPVVKLKDLGIETPVLNLIECNVGFAVGMNNITTTDSDTGNDLAYGLTVTLINVKF